MDPFVGSLRLLDKTTFLASPARLMPHRVLGIIFALVGVVLSILMSTILVDNSSIDGIKLALILFGGGITLLWFLTTERIPLALLILILYLGLAEGYLKIMSDGALFYVVYAIRTVLTIAL